MIAIPNWLRSNSRKENDKARDQLSQVRHAIKKSTEQLEQAIEEATKHHGVKDGN